MTRNRSAPIAVPAIPNITWKAAIGKPIARTNSVATPHTAKKWLGKAPTRTLVTSAVISPAQAPMTTVSTTRNASGRCRVKKEDDRGTRHSGDDEAEN